MGVSEKTVVFENNLMIVNIEQNDIMVTIWWLNSSDDHNFKYVEQVRWENPENAKPIVLSFECVEDKYSGIVYPTLFVCFLNSRSDAHKYLTLIMKRRHAFSQNDPYKWKLQAIKQFKLPVISKDTLISSTFILVGYSDVIYSTCGRLFYCDNISEHEIPLDCKLSKGVDSIVSNMFLIQSSSGDRYITGIISRKFNENIAMETVDIENENNVDDLDINQTLFMIKVIVLDDETLEFVSIKSSDILPEEFDNINGFHIHLIGAQKQNEKSIDPDLKTHAIIIADGGYLLEFKSKTLLHSVCLVRALEQYDSNIDFIENDFVIAGFLEREDRNSLVVMQNAMHCFTVNMASQKVEHLWSDIRHVFVCDILAIGRYQVFMIFQELHCKQKLDQWLITDLDKLINDNRENGQERPEGIRSDGCHAARTALQKQLEILNVSVENEKNKLEEKIDFLEKNLLILKTQSRFASHTEKDSGNYCMNEEREGKIEAVEVWHQVVDSQLVVVVRLINRSHRNVSKISLSLLLNAASNKVFRSESKVHPNLTADYKRFDYASKQTDNPIKKLKIDFDNPVHNDNILYPGQETFISCNCHVADLTIISTSTPAVSVYVHYCFCAIGEDDKPYPVMQICKDGDIILKPRDLNNSSFIERLSKSFSTGDLTDDIVTQDRLSLEAIQEPHKFVIKAKYGCLGRIDYTLSKITGLMFSYVADSHIMLTPGVFYLIRLKISPSTDFRSASTVIYARCDEQFDIFLQYLKTFFSDNVSFEPATQNKLSLAKEFVRQATDEVNHGLQLSTLLNKNPYNTKQIAVKLTDIKDREQATGLQEQFEHEEKTLYCRSETPETATESVENVILANATALRKLEERTDELCFKVLS